MIKQRLLSFMITVPLFNGQKYPVPSRPLSRGPAVITFAWSKLIFYEIECSMYI